MKTKKVNGLEVDLNQSEDDAIQAEWDANDALIPDQKWASIREKRDLLLAKCDWTQAADSPLTAQQITDYATYRQELRDTPASDPDPDNITWPTEPTI